MVFLVLLWMLCHPFLPNDEEKIFFMYSVFMFDSVAVIQKFNFSFSNI